MVAALVETHLKQVFVEATTQVHNTAELIMEVPRQLLRMVLAHQELVMQLCILMKVLIVTILLMERVRG